MIPLIYDAVCASTPRVMHGNWDELMKQSWEWEKNMSDAFRDMNIDFLEELKSEYGPKNVAVGFPFVIGEGPRSNGGPLIGVYVRRRPKSIEESLGDWADTFPVEWVTGGSAKEG
jgi:hypothetical protein